MNVFELKIYDMDGYTSYLYCNSHKTEEQFIEDCGSIIKEYTNVVLSENKHNYFGTDELTDICIKYLPNLGYIQLNTVNLSLSDTYAIGEGYGEDDKILTLLGDNLYREVKLHNKRISERH